MSKRFESNYPLDPKQIEEWVDTFNREGYLFLENVLSDAHVAQLKADFEWSIDNITSTGNEPDDQLRTNKTTNLRLCHRMFEHSPANLNLFDLEPIVSFAEALVAANCHVMHNNSFVTFPGGGISNWHQDDAPHMIVTEGEPPKNIQLPVLAFTCNYYLTDVMEIEQGGTEVIPGSHLFGADARQADVNGEWADKIHYNCGKAGSVVMFNNQVWHRGGPNQTDNNRYITQVSYARRFIGHKYYPFMNYTMPEHVYKGANPRLKRLLGFLEHGAYG